jgi:hypothetical protein
LSLVNSLRSIGAATGPAAGINNEEVHKWANDALKGRVEQIASCRADVARALENAPPHLAQELEDQLKALNMMHAEAEQDFQAYTGGYAANNERSLQKNLDVLVKKQDPAKKDDPTALVRDQNKEEVFATRVVALGTGMLAYSYHAVADVAEKMKALGEVARQDLVGATPAEVSEHGAALHEHLDTATMASATAGGWLIAYFVGARFCAAPLMQVLGVGVGGGLYDLATRKGADTAATGAPMGVIMDKDSGPIESSESSIVESQSLANDDEANPPDHAMEDLRKRLDVTDRQLKKLQDRFRVSSSAIEKPQGHKPADRRKDQMKFESEPTTPGDDMGDFELQKRGHSTDESTDSSSDTDEDYGSPQIPLITIPEAKPRGISMTEEKPLDPESTGTFLDSARRALNFFVGGSQAAAPSLQRINELFNANQARLGDAAPILGRVIGLRSAGASLDDTMRAIDEYKSTVLHAQLNLLEANHEGWEGAYREMQPFLNEIKNWLAANQVPGSLE